MATGRTIAAPIIVSQIAILQPCAANTARAELSNVA